MVARDLYEDLGGLCPYFQVYGTEDVEFCLRAFLLGHDCYIEPNTVLGHLYKDHFITAPTWEQVVLNGFILTYLLLGEEGLAERAPLLRERQQPGLSEGLDAFHRLRPQLDSFRQRIVQRQRRPAQALRDHLARFPKRG
jgi:hypothetical protein